MLRLLFVEDESSAVKPVISLIERELEGSSCEICGFNAAENYISEFRPDIVILDLLAGGSSPESKPEGLSTRDYIWNRRFCPLIVYSAQPEIHDDQHDRHPFIKSIKKGKGSPEKVLKVLKEFSPQVDALHNAEAGIQQSFAIAMRDVAPDAFNHFGDTDPGKRNEMIFRAARRRIAALMDALSSRDDSLESWEQYLSPPIDPGVSLGDVLRVVDGTVEDPSSFRVVLSPSCDMVFSGTRKPKVDKVLVARCISNRQALTTINMCPSPESLIKQKFRNRLIDSVLTQGFFNSVIPFPCLKGRIPSMAADLRSLELIPIADIGSERKAFIRIASIDSPFRELISWAYLQIACRPGLPERNFGLWCDEIVSSLKSELGGDGI